MKTPPTLKRVVVVLSCPSSPESALNVARSLNAEDVLIVLVSAKSGNIAETSRHFDHVDIIPDLHVNTATLIEYLRQWKISSKTQPIVIPTSDADLWMLMRDWELFDAVCQALAPPPKLGMLLSDKALFYSFAIQHDLQVPRTFTPSASLSIKDISEKTDYPVIVKPSIHWKPELIDGLTMGTKAVRVDDAPALVDLFRRIDAVGYQCLVQEFIPGDDDQHFDLQIFISGDSMFSAAFTSQKRRLFPIHSGAGCYVESVDVPVIVEAGMRALRAVGFTGIANVDFKRHATNGKYYMLEVNPRLAHWNIFSASCGINFPVLAYREAIGDPLPLLSRQVTNRYFLDLNRDFSAFRQYNREGEIRMWAYAKTLLRPYLTTYQYWCLSDPVPFVASVSRLIAGRVKMRLHRLHMALTASNF